MEFELLNAGIAHRFISAFNHYVNKVNRLVAHASGLHRSAAYKNSGNVEAHGCKQHSGCHFVAVGDAHQRISLVGVYHILYGVRYKVARGERIEHSVMSHSNAIVNCYGVEFCREASELFNLLLHKLTYAVQMCMTRYELGERVGYGYDRFPHLFRLHAVGTP